MSTLKTTYLQHPSSASENITLNSDGSVDATVNGYATTSDLSGYATTGDLSGYVSKTAVSGSLMSFVGERGNAPSVGQYYAFGNGAADHVNALPYDAKLIAMAIVGAPLHTGTTVVQPVKNGVAQGSSYDLYAIGTSAGWMDMSPPIQYSAGDTFNAEVITAGSGDGTNVTFVFRVD